VIAPDSEAVFYGVLDFFAKPIFGALLIWGHRDIDPARLGLAIKDYDGDALIHEKQRPVSVISASSDFANARLPQATVHPSNVASNGHNGDHTNGAAPTVETVV
jgi:hypothetical protein